VEGIELHRQQPTMQTFLADIVAIDPAGVVELNRTAFYARSGGQQGDTGLLGEVAVRDTIYAQDGRILHVIDPGDLQRLAVGTTIEGRIDWERRSRTMRLHTAQHLLYLAAQSAWGERHNTGGDITDERARIDLARDDGEAAFDLSALTDALTSLIAADTAIERYAGASDARRWYWRTGGLEPIGCGGTHVQSTGEVGHVTVDLKRKGSRNVRLTATLRDSG